MYLNKSLTDVEKILSENKTLKEYIDETGGVFIFASTLMALLIAPNQLSPLKFLAVGTHLNEFKFSRLLGWIPEKLNYWNKGKEISVVERYEK